MNTRSSVGQGVHANACTSDSSSACTRADDTGCSGPFREEGILLRFTPLRSGAHWTFAPPIGGCSQASAHVARHDGAAGRRKTARRQEVVGSDRRTQRNRGNPARRTSAGAVRARSESESRRDPETRRTRKGAQRVARHAPDGGVDRRGSPGEGGYPFVETRTGRRLRRGGGFEALSVVPARRIRLQTPFLRSSLPLACRKADRAASS
jgi:hypothetical protein